MKAKHILIVGMILAIISTVQSTKAIKKGDGLSFEPIESITFFKPEKSNPVSMPKETFQTLFNKGNELFGKQKYSEAIESYNKALEITDRAPQAHFNKGLCLYKTKSYKDAIISFKKAITYKSDYTRAYTYLGKVYHELEEYSQATTQFNKAIEHDPTASEPYRLLARAYNDTHQFEKSIATLKKALLNNPKDKNLLFELANTYNTINRIEESLEIYKKLLENQPNNTSLLYNIAYTLKKLGKVEEALPYYNKTLELKPDHAEAHFSRGLAYLITGDFEKGWPEYEWRWHKPTHGSLRTYPQPKWDGSPLNGKRIFLHSEQGLGDTLQFIRYAQIAKQRGGYVIVAVQSPLVTLLGLCPYIDKVISLKETPPTFDVHAPIMSLPYILNTKKENVPKDIPYLYADPGLVVFWKEKLQHDTNFKIGICWQGNSNYSTPFLRAVVKQKSMPLKTFTPLAAIPGVSLYSIQRVTGVDQLKELPKNFNLHIFEDDFDNTHGRFMDTAAVIKNLDLVITIDTSICHLAAGLGIETWNMLPNPPDWRWMLDCTDTPWYDNMKLYRQPTPGDWESVIANICQDVRKKINSENPEPGYRSTNILSQLEQELHSITTKLTKVGTKLQKTAVRDKTFNDLVRTFYYLDEMKKVIQEKIHALGII